MKKSLAPSLATVLVILVACSNEDATETKMAQSIDGYYLPVHSSFITSGWYYDSGSIHYGIDYDGLNCSTPILAAADGEVINVDRAGHTGWGGTLEILHSDGSQTKYSHLCLSEIYVENGEYVYGGEIVGLMGNTGSVFSEGGDGSHLDFRIKPQGCNTWWGSCLIDLSSTPFFRHF